MKAEYTRILTIAAVAIVTLYLLHMYGGSLAAQLGLTPVA